MVPRFPFLIVLLLSFPLFASIHGTAERELTQRQLDVAESGQANSRIASDGTSFLTVWADSRYGGHYDILGARLAQNGEVVDAVPLVLANTPSMEQEPAVAWGRGRYLAAWVSDNRDVRGRFIAGDGTMSDVIEIGTRSVIGGGPSSLKVVFNGRVFLAAWFEYGQGESSYHAAIIDPDGRVLVERKILPAASYDFQLATMAGTFYFLNVDRQRVLAIPLDDSASPGDPILIDDSPYPVSGIRTATHGDDTLIAWTGSSPANYIQSVLLTRNGGQERAAFDTGAFFLQDVVADADGYLLLYGDFNSVRARRLGSESETPVAVPQATPTVDSAASNGSRTVALIHTTGSYDIFSGDLWTSVIGDDRVAPLVVAPRHQTAPDIAVAGDRTLVVWADYRTAERRVIVAGMRVDANGHAFEFPPIEIGAFTTFEPRHPHVATNGTDWLVIWQYNGGVLGRRIRRDGTFLDTTPLNLGSYASDLLPFGQGQTAVTWDGTSYVVVYTGGTIGRFTSLQTFVTRVPSAGDPEQTFSINQAGSNFNPAIAAGPNGSLIVWSADNQLRGVLLSPGDAMTPVNFPARFGGTPSVAWNRDAFLVAVDTPPFSGGIDELRWARVDASGNALESFSTINVGPADTPPRVVPFGDRFLLLWPQQHLFGAILDRNGNLLDGPSVIAENTPEFSADGAQLVTSHPIPDPTHTSRVFLQSVEWTPEIVPRMRSVRH